MRVKVHSIYDQFTHHRAVDGEPYVDLYVDYNCLKEPIQDNSIAVLIEPRSIQPQVYKWMEENYSKFAYVFTHDSILLNYDNAKLILWGGGGGGIVECEHKRKKKDVSLVCSDKTMCQKHIDRISLARRLKDHPHVDVMGTFDGGVRVTAQQIYQDYKFSIAYENHIDYDWFSEKICNCFANKVVPIYLGAIHIKKYFNTDGILVADSNYEVQELIEWLSKIGFERFYNQDNVQFAIKDNYFRVQQYANFETWFFNNYDELLEGMK